MSYSHFTLKKVQREFNLKIIEEVGLFSDVEEVEISEYLAFTLAENVPLAVAINTEKARSELIIANVLVELRRLFNYQISLFSGIEFNVDKERGLGGFCDFIMSLSSEQLFLNAPLITIVEAKNENLMSGLGQCVAEMVAAQLFNEQEGNTLPTIYGIITSGVAWRFLALSQKQLKIDLKDYSIYNAEQVVGIISAMIRQEL